MYAYACMCVCVRVLLEVNGDFTVTTMVEKKPNPQIRKTVLSVLTMYELKNMTTNRGSLS